MKKIKFILSAMLMGIVGLTSCNNASDKAAEGAADSAKADAKDSVLIKKIEAKEALTPEEYSKVIKYVGEYAEKAQKFLDMQNADPTSAEAQTGLDNLKKEYPEYELYKGCIKTVAKDKLSENDLKEIGKYAGLVYFTVPDWYEIQTADNEMAGVVMDAPTTGQTDSTDIVAESVDTVKVERSGW